jgi:hypothetical protein
MQLELWGTGFSSRATRPRPANTAAFIVGNDGRESSLTGNLRAVMRLARRNRRKGGGPMSHSMVARRAEPAIEALVTSAGIG